MKAVRNDGFQAANMVNIEHVMNIVLNLKLDEQLDWVLIVVNSSFPTHGDIIIYTSQIQAP